MKTNLREVAAAAELEGVPASAFGGRNWGYVFALLGTVFFSMKSIFVKLIYQPVNGMDCLLYTSPSPRDATLSRMPSSA